MNVITEVTSALPSILDHSLSLSIDNFQIKGEPTASVAKEMFEKTGTILQKITSEKIKNVLHLSVIRSEPFVYTVTAFIKDGTTIYFSYTMWIHHTTGNLSIEAQILNQPESYLIYKDIFHHVKKVMVRIYGDKIVVERSLY
jgi:hypothetical protein